MTIYHELETLLDELYIIGRQPAGGVYRPVYSDAWHTAQQRVARWMSERGLAVRQDSVGNLFGRIEGSIHGPVVATGSHIDTVRNGGRLDGALGVVGGLLAVSTLYEQHGQPRLPMEVMVTCEEEGSRFPNNFWGALSILGESSTTEASAYVDDDGISLAAAMTALGHDPRRIGDAKRNDIGYFLELHIEQGGILEKSQQSIGVVTAITGITHLEVRVMGRADHAGTTPMLLRSDALTAAARMVVAIEEIVHDFGSPAVATVGKIQVHPAQVNVVPDNVLFTVDLRHADRATQIALRKAIEGKVEAIGREQGNPVTVIQVDDHPPVPMDAEVVNAVESAAKAMGASYRLMPSGAGHDAQIMARCCRAGMIFVPSLGGRSHTPDEHTNPPDLALGVHVLTNALFRLAYG